MLAARVERLRQSGQLPADWVDEPLAPLVARMVNHAADERPNADEALAVLEELLASEAMAPCGGRRRTAPVDEPSDDPEGYNLSEGPKWCESDDAPRRTPPASAAPSLRRVLSRWLMSRLGMYLGPGRRRAARREKVAPSVTL